MFIDIIHANGQYDPQLNTHTNPFERKKTLGMLTLGIEDALAQGAAVLYRPNYGWHTEAIAADEQALEKAQQSDPLLRGLSKKAKSLIAVQPDGAGASSERLREIARVEDRAARKHGTVLVLGAFTSVCVLNAAQSIKRRVPNALVSIDSRLSVELGSKAWRPDERIRRMYLASHLSPRVAARMASFFGD